MLRNPKKSLFSRIFQPKEKPKITLDEPKISQEEKNKDEIEIKEVIEEKLEANSFEEQSIETIPVELDSENKDLDEELLAIPSFLRRQAN